MRIYTREPVIERMHAMGERLRTGIRQAAERHGVSDNVNPIGRASNMVFTTFDGDGKPSQGFRTLFLQETLRRGVLMPSLVVSYSHGEDEVDRTIDAVDGALGVYARALSDGWEAHLDGRPSQVVYRSMNTSETAIRR
jgi:glutamate-1-semialdehyde 2,1-aminomutase